MAAEESWPWRCVCNRLNGKRHTHCPDCKRHWSKGVRHSNEPKSPRAYQQQGDQYAHWDYPKQPQRRGRGNARGQDQHNNERSESAKRKGQGKGKKEDVPSPFLNAAAIPPWPSQDSTVQSVSLSSTSTLTGNLAAHTDLVSAVRKQYPDISQAPEDIRIAMEKAEKANPKVLASELNKASSQVGKIAKQLASIREARQVHRQNWLRHLKDSASTWQKQIQRFKEQQQQYGEQLSKAQLELTTARRNLQYLNKLAAASGTPTTAESGEPSVDPPDPDANAAFETEAQALALQIQTQLQEAAAAAANEEMEVLSDDEEADRERKRQRSMEPFGHIATPGALPAPGASPSS
eukprot:s2213_g3.t1